MILTCSAKEEENRESPGMETTTAPLPPSSGYTVGKKMPPVVVSSEPTNQKKDNKTHKPRIRPNRMKVIADMPSEKELAEVKWKKKVHISVFCVPFITIVNTSQTARFVGYLFTSLVSKSILFDQCFVSIVIFQTYCEISYCDGYKIMR